MSGILRSRTCACCGDLLAGRFDRRSFLKAAGGAGMLAAFPFAAFAAGGNYDAMVLSCIDPRFPALTLDYMKGRGLPGKYSQFVIAGAAIGVVAPKFSDWHKAFWDNLAATIELHGISRVIALDHRDCGAASIAYGDASIATPQAETDTHRSVFVEFRRQMSERQPKLAVKTGLMGLDGTVELLS
jgi:carbonic anhydrase